MPARGVGLSQSFNMSEMATGEFEHLIQIDALGFLFARQTPNGTARTPDCSINPTLSLEPTPVRQSLEAFARLKAKATPATAQEFLEALVEAVPHQIHTVLTDHGIQFADLPKDRDKPTALWRRHPFDLTCRMHGIEHRLIKPTDP